MIAGIPVTGQNSKRTLLVDIGSLGYNHGDLRISHASDGDMGVEKMEWG